MIAETSFKCAQKWKVDLCKKFSSRTRTGYHNASSCFGIWRQVKKGLCTELLFHTVARVYAVEVTEKDVSENELYKNQ